MNIYKIPILKRLIPSLIRRYKILFNPIIKNFEIDNLKIDLDIRESLERKIYFEKKYEEERLIYLIQKIKTHQLNIFIDVGANIGLYSLRVAKNIPNINQVISFEPLLETFNKLKKNIIKNNLEKKINIYNYGLSAQ
jgi:predicted O-methyltransferase YrrM